MCFMPPCFDKQNLITSSLHGHFYCKLMQENLLLTSCWFCCQANEWVWSKAVICPRLINATCYPLLMWVLLHWQHWSNHCFMLEVSPDSMHLNTGLLLLWDLLYCIHNNDYSRGVSGHKVCPGFGVLGQSREAFSNPAWWVWIWHEQTNYSLLSSAARILCLTQEHFFMLFITETPFITQVLQTKYTLLSKSYSPKE